MSEQFRTPVFSSRKGPLISLLPLILAVLVFAFSMGNIATNVFDDPDTFIHLASGAWIVENYQIPSIDPFSFNTVGLHWAAHEWLAQLILFFSYAMGGLFGVRILIATLFAFTLAYQLRFLVARMPAPYALLLSALSFTALLSHHLARPHVLTWPIITYWFIGLLRSTEQGSWKAPYFLAPWMVLWANLHGGFILGLLAVPFFGLEVYLATPKNEQKKALGSWGVFFLFALACSLITPFGLSGITFGLNLASAQYTSRIIEWAPTAGYDLLPIVFWLIALLGMALLGYLRLPLVRLLLLLGFVYESFSHVRYTSMFGLVAPLLVAQSFGQHYQLRHGKENVPNTTPSLANKKNGMQGRYSPLGLASVIVLAILFWGYRYQINQANPYYAPSKAVDFVEQSHITGNVLNYYNVGGYLIFRKIPVFIDSRADLYGDRKISEYFSITDLADTAKTRRLMQEHEIAWTIFPPDEKIVSYLNSEPGWQKVYEDPYAVVHIRK